MKHAIMPLTLATCAVLISAGSALSQYPGNPSGSEVSATSPVAYVYVQTSKGVNLYDAAANGRLTLIKGSPFKTVGEMIGSNKTFFVTLGTNLIHIYAIEANGAIGKQVSTINTQDYSGASCGTNSGGTLDSTGHVLYVRRYNDDQTGDEACAALQSYSLSSAGTLSFLGTVEYATVTDTGLYAARVTRIKLSGDGRFAYSAALDHECLTRMFEFQRQSSGEMLLNNYEHLGIPSTPPDWEWYPWVLTPDPSIHMAVALTGQSGDFDPCGDTDHVTQLASFTEASDGSLTTTNTPSNMPAPKVNPTLMKMSPSGKLLAVGGDGAYAAVEGTQRAGLQVFHFNGANPITAYSKVLTTAAFGEGSVHWDKSDHLYALGSPKANVFQLFVYTVTPTSITEAPGSPYTVTPSASEATRNSLVVVSR